MMNGESRRAWKRQIRWASLGLLTCALIVPLGLVESVVRERHATYRGVLQEIAGLWSGEQVLAGPLLVLPFTERFQVEEEHFNRDGERSVNRVWKTCEKRAVLLPKELALDGQMEPSLRRRGIYEAQVYENVLRLGGRFEHLADAVSELSETDRLHEIHWDRAALVVGLSEPKGIVRLASLAEDLRFAPGSGIEGILPRGFHAEVRDPDQESWSFSLELVFRGSDGFRWTPVGESNRAMLVSSWQHPSFYGEVIPDSYEIGGEGFSARWELSHLIRSYPQAWVEGDAVELGEVTTGARLFEPVALYARVTRSVKYGLLFVALTFLSLGLIELVTGTRLRFVQYLLIGLALALFFLILIACGEHLGFALAYLIAATTVVVLNLGYCWALLPRRSLALLVGAVLAALYAVLYAILRLEDYALLSGTALLVAALAATMYFTRHLGQAEERRSELALEAP